VNDQGAPVLEVSDLAVEYGEGARAVRALRGVSFELRRGERLGIVGESGSGKSTLAQCLLGLIEPPGRVVGGTVTLGGDRLDFDDESTWSAVRGRRVSLIYQDPMMALDPVKTVGQQIAEAIVQHHPRMGRRAVRERVVEVLREVGVPDPELRVDSYPHQYSGGMRQRVVIAMAIVNEPDIVVADEPTTALDVTTQAQILRLLARLASEHGSAVILVTHNMGVVAEFCDRTLVLYAGRGVEEGSTVDLFHAQGHPYTEALLAAVVRPDRLPSGRLPSIGGMPPALDVLPVGCVFEPRCPRSRPRCATEAPANRDLRPVGRDGSAECHYAVELLERTGGSDGQRRKG
jgi:oligopeptide/dipeptide ABC transporter ATP-binding protein